MFMERVSYPDWVEKYRGKGKTIRKVRNGYGLYQCTSVYVKGMKYPKSKQVYLGMITEKDGFIPKTIFVSSPEYLEYGLSHFIYLNFKRDLSRSLYSATDELIQLGIVYFVFDACSDYFICHCYLTFQNAEELIRYRDNISFKRITTVAKAISKTLIHRIEEETDRTLITSGLKLCVIEKQSLKTPVLPTEIAQAIERNHLRYD